MPEQLRDGTGSGYLAEVDESNRLLTRSIEKSEDKEATENGDSFNINSGLITLTTDGESGILYVTNNDTTKIHVTGIVAILGPSTGGDSSDTTRVRIYKNPTAFSSSTVVDINSNRNFASSKTLTGDFYKGAEGATITDGTTHIESLINPGSRVFFAIDEFLDKGNTIAVSYEPNDSNTSMKCMAAIICHKEVFNGS